MGNGNGDGWFYRALAPLAIIFTLAQLVGGLLWAGAIHERVNVLTREHAAFVADFRNSDQRLEAKIDSIDQHGTRALEVVQDRQRAVFERIGRIDAAIERIERRAPEQPPR